MNKSFYYVILLATAMAVSCTKDSAPADEVADNSKKEQKEAIDWNTVPVNHVSKDKFFFTLEEDVIFPEDGEYKFDSYQDNLISGSITAVLLPEGRIDTDEAVESRIPRLLAVQIGFKDIPYSVSESNITLDSSDNSVKVAFIDAEWDTVELETVTGTLDISGHMDQEGMQNKGDISCDMSLFLEMTNGEHYRLHFTKLSPGTPPFSMN